MVRAAIFDMDKTLLSCDCDMTWKSYAAAAGLASPDAVAQAEKFLRDYDAGTLDQVEFLRFQWAEFRGKSEAECRRLAADHFAACVLPHCRKPALAEVNKLRAENWQLLMLTSTARILAEPVAKYFGFSEMRGAEISVADGIVTGNLVGIYPCGPGKVQLAKAWAKAHDLTLAECRAYGDSINDLPLLAACGEAVAVNPSAALARAARENTWSMVDWEEANG